MNFAADPYISACQVLDPEDRQWFYRPPPHSVHVEETPCATSARIPKQIKQGKTLRDDKFIDVVNDVLIRVVQDLKFQNDALKLFLFQMVGEDGPVDFDSPLFLKLVLILRSLGLKGSKGNRTTELPPFQGRRRFRQHCIAGAVRLVGLRLLSLYDCYEEKKLDLISAWSMQEATLELSSHKALAFLKSNMELASGERITATHLYSHVVMWLHRMASENGAMEMVVKQEQKKLKHWWLVAQKIAGFEETLSGPPAHRYLELINMCRLIEIKQRSAYGRMDSVIPWLDILRSQAAMFKENDEDEKACRMYLKKIRGK